MNVILRLFEHLAWADARVLERLRGGDEASGGLELFAHLLAAERVWLARLRREDSSALEIWPDLSLDQCAALADHLRAGLAAHLATLSEAGLRERVRYRTSAGVEFETEVGDILTHLALHGAYHRGQIATRMRQRGEEPVNTDYITFVRETPPLPIRDAS
jgi:uncharacterized damage-inducible protein DinB